MRRRFSSAPDERSDTAEDCRDTAMEPPEGDPMRHVAPAWEAALNAGKDSVACNLKAEPELGRALCAKADVVLEGFRPGVAARLGVGPDDLPERVVYCSITGFGTTGPRADRSRRAPDDFDDARLA